MYKLGNLTFIAHPRTGSQSVRTALLEAGAECIAGHHGIDESRLTANVISAVRNPWDIMVSWYHYVHLDPKQLAGQEYIPFGEWLPRALNGEDKFVQRWFSQKLFFGLPYCNQIIYWEGGIERQLNHILNECDLPHVKLPRRGATEREFHFPSYYAQGDSCLVYEKFKDEIDRLGYKFPRPS